MPDVSALAVSTRPSTHGAAFVRHQPGPPLPTTVVQRARQEVDEVVHLAPPVRNVIHRLQRLGSATIRPLVLCRPAG